MMATLMFLLPLTALADNTPVGLWKTVDDTTGREKGLVRITADNGVLTGRIEGSLGPTPPPSPICHQCSDDRKDQPLLGMAILRNVRAATEAGTWDGGDILDPDNGKVYRVRLRPVDNGEKLEVRGYIGVAMFGRTQTWIRAR